MKFAKGSAGHLLAEAFMLPEFYAGRRSYAPTKKRTGRRYTKRKAKPRRDNFLTVLMHAQMRDWAGKHGLGRSAQRKAERQRARAVRP